MPGGYLPSRLRGMTADLASRIRRVQDAMAAADVAGLVVTPGSDLRYLTGYDAKPLERLTALVVPREGDPRLVVPALEVAEAERSPAALAGMDVVTHGETDDAYAVAVDGLRDAATVAVDDHMWARAGLRRSSGALPDARLVAAGPLLSDLRMRKGADEVASLRQAGAGDRPGARADGGVPQGRPHRARGGSPDRGGHHRRGTRHGRLRDRRVGPERRLAPPLGVRPRDRARRHGRDRHRRLDGRRLLLRLAPGRTPSERVRRSEVTDYYDVLLEAQRDAVRLRQARRHGGVGRPGRSDR